MRACGWSKYHLKQHLKPFSPTNFPIRTEDRRLLQSKFFGPPTSVFRLKSTFTFYFHFKYWHSVLNYGISANWLNYCLINFKHYWVCPFALCIAAAAFIIAAFYEQYRFYSLSKKILFEFLCLKKAPQWFYFYLFEEEEKIQCLFHHGRKIQLKNTRKKISIVQKSWHFIH